MFSNMPNTPSKHDHEMVAHALKINGLCKNIYSADFTRLHVMGFDHVNQLLRLEYRYIDIFGTINEMEAISPMSAELNQLTIENFIPQDNNSNNYAEFKELSLMVDWMVDGSISTDPLIAALVEQGVEAKSPNDTKVIYNPQTLAFMFYSPSQDHPYSFMFGDVVIESDCFDFAYKLAYDSKEYESKRLAEYKKHLNSPEMESAMDEMVKNLVANSQATQDFHSSARFTELMEKAKAQLVTHDTAINYSNCVEFGFVDSDEFMMFYNAVSRNGDRLDDEEATFKTLYVLHDGLEFAEVHGQGSYHYIKLSERIAA
ncbi:hypothetical protein LMH73_018595 [Vibrio splendidus]|nr:hypothetical protein [Vibrio splendidus]MCC4882752.1 hypothetical protein [Vibrio splendidus]